MTVEVIVKAGEHPAFIYEFPHQANGEPAEDGEWQELGRIEPGLEITVSAHQSNSILVTEGKPIEDVR